MTDFHVDEFARLLKKLPPHLPISDAFEDTLLAHVEDRWPTQRLHMTTWFEAQATKGSGQYTRETPNISAKTTYNRLQSPYGLMWIAEALGVEEELLQKAAAEALAAPRRSRSAVIRKHIPWEMIAELAEPKMSSSWIRLRLGPKLGRARSFLKSSRRTKR
ncbi:MAG: hypothetical protein Q4E01_01435 [Actinomycetaceae bacterium]|nr:hypothetical protein [Actinomycetaceae bacterium]